MAKWFRVHVGTWHDYKLQELNWMARASWYGLMELCAESNMEEGAIQGSVHRIAKWMGMNTSRWAEIEKQYEMLTLCQRQGNLLYILNWKKRQYIPDKQRVDLPKI
jgi:hypothetical protein